jgi:hypothetical protein
MFSLARLFVYLNISWQRTIWAIFACVIIRRLARISAIGHRPHRCRVLLPGLLCISFLRGRCSFLAAFLVGRLTSSEKYLLISGVFSTTENLNGLCSISFIDGGQIQEWWLRPKVYGRISRSFDSSSYNRSSSVHTLTFVLWQVVLPCSPSMSCRGSFGDVMLRDIVDLGLVIAH